MCGIGGYIDFNKKNNLGEPTLKSVIKSIKHRGPDADAFWIHENVGFCHVRLSIIDLSENSNQPMHYLENRYTIVFNGEIYNYIELKHDLEKAGYVFKTNSDTEVILACYDQKREKCLADFDGMFSFAIWDKQEKQMFCARDRFGEKPFYYYKDNGQFLFCSEIKGLWEMGVHKKVNNKRLFLSLVYESLVMPNHNLETYYENVLQIEPSHYMVIKDNGEILYKKYYELSISENKSITQQDAISEIRKIMTDSVGKRLRSDVTVGTSLSGGIDSSIIANVVSQQTKNFKTFSARYHDFDKDEGKYIDCVTKELGLQNIATYPSNEELYNLVDKLHWYFDNEPILTTSVFSQFCVMRLASESQTKVLIDGQGADEIFAGYPAYRENYYNYLFSAKHSQELVKELEGLSEIHHSTWEPKRISKQNDFIVKIENMIRKTRHLTLGVNGYNKQFIKNGWCKWDLQNQSQLSLKQDLHRTLFNGQLQDLLKNADRNSMANGVEVRLPFLSHKLAEFVFTLPDNFLIQNGYSKFILRESFRGIVPDVILNRTDKIGFVTPQENWLNTPEFSNLAKARKLYLIEKGIMTAQNTSSTWKLITSSYLFKDA